MLNNQRTVTIKTLQAVTITRQAKKAINNNYQLKDSASDLEKLINVAHYVVITSCRHMYNNGKKHGKNLEFVKDLQLLTSSQRLQYVQRVNAGWAIERAYNTDNDHVQTAFAVLYQYYLEGIKPFDKVLKPLRSDATKLQSSYYRAGNAVKNDIFRRYKQDRNTDFIEDKQAKGQQLTDKTAKIALPDYEIIAAWLDNCHMYQKQPKAKKQAIKTLLIWMAKGYNVTQASQKAGISSKTGYNYLDMIKPDIIKQV